MKVAALFCLLAIGVEALRQKDEHGARIKADERVQTKEEFWASGGIKDVVTQLRAMSAAAKKDWNAEAFIYDGVDNDKSVVAVCTRKTAEHTSGLNTDTTQIETLSNLIEMKEGSNGMLSVKCANLKTDIAENVQSLADATALRASEQATFDALKKDLDAANAQMTGALATLAAVGADQTSSEAAEDSKKFMAGADPNDASSLLARRRRKASASLMNIQSSIQKALVAADAFVAPDQQEELASFLQISGSPGAYSAQSGQVVGILKNMQDTIIDNLKSATAKNVHSQSDYDKFKVNKDTEKANKEAAYTASQTTIGENDVTLGSSKTALNTAKSSKNNNGALLDALTKECKVQADLYIKRKRFAGNEDIALEKAIGILDSGATDFGAVDATKFLQLDSYQNLGMRRSIAHMLLRSKGKDSIRVRQVALFLQAGNPFDVVLKEIRKMITVSKIEQKKDNEEKAWCVSTNAANAEALKKERTEITGDKAAINDDLASINNLVTGHKAQIEQSEANLKSNQDTQGAESVQRRADNLKYQRDQGTMRDVRKTLVKGVNVLKTFYANLASEQIGFIQIDSYNATEIHNASTHAALANGSISSNEFTGQNQGPVVTLLNNLISATVAEENAAHLDELRAQHAYEDSMAALVAVETTTKTDIVKQKANLAKAEAKRGEDRKAKIADEKQKISIERYIVKLKPGCDFIINKHDARKTAREAEKAALASSITKLESSPAFKAAIAKSNRESFGTCLGKCTGDDKNGNKNDPNHVKCKACMGDVTIPGYCAGHAGTPGC